MSNCPLRPMARAVRQWRYGGEGVFALDEWPRHFKRTRYLAHCISAPLQPHRARRRAVLHNMLCLATRAHSPGRAKKWAPVTCRTPSSGPHVSPQLGGLSSVCLLHCPQGSAEVACRHSSHGRTLRLVSYHTQTPLPSRQTSWSNRVSCHGKCLLAPSAKRRKKGSR